MLTGWLPSTRLICGSWGALSFHHNNTLPEDAQGWGAKKLRAALDHCEKYDFEMSATGKYGNVIANHPKLWFGLVLTCCTVFAVPPVLNYVFGSVAKKRHHQHQEMEESDETDDGRSDSSQ